MRLSASLQTIAIPDLRRSLWQKTDLRNVALLIAGFALVLAVVPPVRTFPTDDDWVYAWSVQDILSGHYKLPQAQATALGHTIWGAFFSWLFGFNFTTLSIVALIAGVACLVLMYILLRQLGIATNYCLLGAAMLGCNPIFVYLSYSFMTDITFLAYILGACVCFVRAFRDYSLKWLLFAATITSLAYLTRQFGLLIVPVALIYIWWSHGWRWRNVIAMSAFPVATAVAYTLWERTQQVPIAVYYADSFRVNAMSDIASYAVDRVQAIALILATLGLCIAPLARIPKRLWLSLPIFVCIIGFQARSTQLTGSPFPVNGNIIDNTGLFSSGNNAPIWNLPVWLLLGIVGAAIISAYLVVLAEQLVQWLRTSPWRNRTSDPIFFIYSLGGVLGAATVVVGISAPFMFDRYVLPVLPMLIVPTLLRLRQTDKAGNSPLRKLRWLALLPLALFAVLGQHDYLARETVRWQAAEELVTQGVPMNKIYAGYAWQGWHLYAEGEEFLRARGDFKHVPFPPDAVLDPKYGVMELTGDEYAEIGSVPYVSWLEGGTTRNMLVLKRK